MVDLFARLGLRTLGQLGALPVSAVAARFGPPGLLAHRLARGEPGHEPVARDVPAELVETIELDPPATRVDEAAFAAKALADRLLGRLDAMGACCTRVMVEAETEHGERLTRCWRHEGALTPATLVARVRWQLEAWLVASDAGVAAPGATVDDAAAAELVTGGLAVLRLAPDDVVPATGRQLGFWGGDPTAADRAGRALARVQSLLGPDAVATAVPVGGRTPLERVRWVPWGEAPSPAGGRAADGGDAPWPGAVPGPAPARVFDAPVPAVLLDATGVAGERVGAGRGVGAARPARLRGPARGWGRGGRVGGPVGPRPAVVGATPSPGAVAGGGRHPRHRGRLPGRAGTRPRRGGGALRLIGAERVTSRATGRARARHDTSSPALRGWYLSNTTVRARSSSSRR